MPNRTSMSITEVINKSKITNLIHNDDVNTLVSNIRLPALMLLDASESMQGYEKVMQEAIQNLYKRLLENNFARSSAELGIISFNEEFEVLEPIREISKQTERETAELAITCRYQTLTGLALAAALDHLEHRILSYRENFTGYYSPILFFFSDGNPYCDDEDTRKEDEDALERVLEKIGELVRNNELTVIAYELGDHCNHELMRQITGLDDDRHVRKISKDSDEMASLFKITSSMIITASQRGSRDVNKKSIDEMLQD